MKKLIALIMALVLAVSMAAMASAANTETAHDHDCQDCASVSVQPRAAGPYCPNSVCGYAPLMVYQEMIPVVKCKYCSAYARLYYCPVCGVNYDCCSNGHIFQKQWVFI